MKNIGLCLAMITFLMISSCNKKGQQTETTETTTTSTSNPDTVVVKHEAPKETGTSVKIDSSGIGVNSKKVNVEIKKSRNKLELK